VGARRAIEDRLVIEREGEALERAVVRESGVDVDVFTALRALEKEMIEAADALEYERAAALRDEMQELKHAAGLDDSKPVARGGRGAKRAGGGRYGSHRR
jgi:excinuclease ABC subunit B